MPPSEHSSFEKASLNNVSILPVVVNCSLSSISPCANTTIIQASYADVTRMHSASVILTEKGLINPDCEKVAASEEINIVNSGLVQEKLQKGDTIQPGGSDWVISRLSQLDQNSNPMNSKSSLAKQNENKSVTSCPVVVSLEKPSFYNTSLQSNKNSCTVVASLSNDSSSGKKSSDSNLTLDYLCSLEKMPVEKLSFFATSVQEMCVTDVPNITSSVGTSTKTDSVYSSPSSISSLSDTFKSVDNNICGTQNFSKVSDPPVVIMSNCLPPQNISEISFGIEYEEMMKLCADSCEASPLTLQDSSDSCFSEKMHETDDSVTKIKFTDINETVISDSDNFCGSRNLLIGGMNFCWKEFEVDYQESNLSQLGDYFIKAWNEIEDCKAGFSDSCSGKVKYFHEFLE